jgi:hypothetical protein
MASERDLAPTALRGFPAPRAADPASPYRRRTAAPVETDARARGPFVVHRPDPPVLDPREGVRGKLGLPISDPAPIPWGAWERLFHVLRALWQLAANRPYVVGFVVTVVVAVVSGTWIAHEFRSPYR